MSPHRSEKVIMNASIEYYNVNAEAVELGVLSKSVRPCPIDTILEGDQLLESTLYALPVLR